MNEVPFYASLIPVVQAVVEAMKRLLNSPEHPDRGSKFAPAVSMVLGIGLSFLVTMTVVPPMDTRAAIVQAILGGLVVGASASGIYSYIKSGIEQRADDEIEAAQR